MEAKKEEVEIKDNAVPNKVRVLEKKVNWLVAAIKQLERQFGLDLNQDGKIGSIRVGVVALTALVTLGLLSALGADNILKYPTKSGGTALTLDTDGVLTVGSNITASGTISGAGGTLTAPTLTNALIYATNGLIQGTVITNSTINGTNGTLSNVTLTNSLVYATNGTLQGVLITNSTVNATNGTLQGVTFTNVTVSPATYWTNAIPFLGATTNLQTNTTIYVKFGAYWLTVTNNITP